MGQYRIIGNLGEGGMSQVFRAVDIYLGREVALKVLHQSLSSDSALTAMFEREAKLTASILHPNVVKVYTVGKAEGYFFIAMELVDALSLEEVIAKNGGIAERQVLNIAHDVVSGLKAAYHEGLIHRDIKPGNMLVMDEGTSKLVDFGLAVHQGGDDESEEIWATPFYVPPEKLDGETDTYLGDIYSLGATLYHAIAGVPPFEANTSSLEELKEIKQTEVDLKALAPGLSKPTLKLIQRMMAYSPANRPDSYDALLAEIEEIEKRVFGHQRSTRLSDGPSRKPWLVAGVISALVAVGIGVGVYVSASKTTGSRLKLNSKENLISVGADSNAANFLKGRELLAAGRFSQAEEIFEALSETDSLSPSTRMWNCFFLGTVRLLRGDEIGSREAFASISAIAPGRESGVEDVIVFLQEASGPLGGPLPLMEGESLFSADSIESIGLLVGGLKNWQQGSFDTGMELLEAFHSSAVPEQFDWVEKLKTNVEVYRSDYEVWQSLPNPSRADDGGGRAKARQELTKAVESIKTRGALPDLIQQRLSRIEDIVAQIAREKEPIRIEEPKGEVVGNDATVLPPTASDPEQMDPFSDSKLSPEEKEEKRKLIGVLSSLVEYSDTFLFSEGVTKLQSLPLDSWTIQELRQDLAYGYGMADGFVGMLADQMNEVGYEGTIRRREGVPLDAKVTSADQSSFVVDLGFGPNTVSVTSFSNDWLIEVAEKVLPPVSTETQTAWEQIVFFALATNQPDTANRISEMLVSASPEFEKRWKRLMSLSGN